jgi:transposase
MENKQRHMAKVQLMAHLQTGFSWQTAAAKAGLQISQSNAYRLLKAFRLRGEAALSDRRHGHPSKLRGAARTFLEEQCRQAPQTPSSVVQVELRERFNLRVSISQINRVRAALGVSNHSKCPEPGKKGGRGWCFPSTRVARRRWQPPVACFGSSDRLAHRASNNTFPESPRNFPFSSSRSQSACNLAPSVIDPPLSGSRGTAANLGFAWLHRPSSGTAD